MEGNMVGWITASAALLGGLMLVFQSVRYIGRFEGRDEERWHSLNNRLDNIEGRLERIEQNGSRHV